MILFQWMLVKFHLEGHGVMIEEQFMMDGRTHVLFTIWEEVSTIGKFASARN